MKSILHILNRKNYSFIFLTLVALLLAALTLRLSLWQFERAQEKKQLESQATLAQSKKAINLPAAKTPINAFMRIRAVGRYQPESAFLLDNRTHQKKAGFHVITPLQLNDGRMIVVKRGWIGHGGNRQSVVPPAPPSGLVTVTGALYFDNRNAFVLSDKKDNGLIRQRIDLTQYALEINQPVVSLILIEESAKPPLISIPVPINFKSQRSTIYAWQWLSLFCLTVFIYIYFGIKNREK